NYTNFQHYFRNLQGCDSSKSRHAVESARHTFSMNGQHDHRAPKTGSEVRGTCTLESLRKSCVVDLWFFANNFFASNTALAPSMELRSPRRSFSRKRASRMVDSHCHSTF